MKKIANMHWTICSFDITGAKKCIEGKNNKRRYLPKYRKTFLNMSNKKKSLSNNDISK